MSEKFYPQDLDITSIATEHRNQTKESIVNWSQRHSLIGSAVTVLLSKPKSTPFLEKWQLIKPKAETSRKLSRYT